MATVERKCKVLTAIQQALLGEVSSRLRAVTVYFDDHSINFTCYYDGEVLDDDRESMSCVETELLALFPETHKVAHLIQRRDFPEQIPKNEMWVYFRKE